MTRHRCATTSRANSLRKELRQRKLKFESLEERRVLAYAAAVLADSPIAYYRFEEAAGSATTANAGTIGAAANGIVNNVTLGNPSALPALGNTGTFANGHIRIPDSAAFDLGTGNYTLEFWFNSSSAARGDIFTNKGGGVDVGVHYASQGAGTASLYHNGFISTTPPVLATNNWYHVAMVRSGTGANQTVIYVNGIPASYGTSGQNWNNVNSDLVIGSNHNNNLPNLTIPFQGQIDEFAIYNKALTQHQIRQHIVAAFDSYSDFIDLGLNPSVYYEFNEAAGTNVLADSSGNNRQGTVINGSTLGVPSASLQMGTGIELNGSNQYVSVAAANTLGLNGSFTASAWVRPDALDGDRSIFGTDVGADNQGLHFILRNGEPWFGFYNNDTAGGANNILSVGEWYHLAWRYDAASGEQSIYLNGAQIARRTGAAAFIGTSTVNIGRWGNGNYFDGRIDEAAIFPSALPHGAIQALYQQGLSAHANDDTAATTQQTPVNIPVVANDQGVLAGVIATSGNDAGTSVTINANGSLAYNPGTAFNSLADGQTATDTLTYEVLMHEDYGNRRIVLGQFGPNGTYNAYMWDPVVRTWDEARVAGYSTLLNGTPGKLVEVNSLAENNFLAQAFRNADGGGSLDFWLGISDSEQRSAIDLVQLTGTEAGSAPLTGWHYGTGGQITFSNWGGGEPNNSGGEDATHMRGDGQWNDHQSGGTLGEGGHQLPAVYEFQLGLASPADFVAPGFTVRQVRSNASVGNLTDTEALLAAGSANNIAERTMHYSVINMSGNGDGRFVDNLPYPFAGDGSNFAVEATGQIFIPAAGDYTFIVNSDDGFSLSMPGSTLSSPVNDNGSTLGLDGVLRFNAGRGAADTLGVFSFPSRGFYPIRLAHWEGGGGDSVELSAAPGAHGAYNSSFSLVGDIAGLKVYNQIPTALLQTATVDVEITGVNDAPDADAGPAVSIDEGDSAMFDASASFDVDQGAVLTYSWDINGDGTFGDATGVNPTLTVAQLEALGIDGPFTTNNVRVRVSDGVATTTSPPTSLTVANVAPTLTFAGPLGAAPGFVSTFTFSATDPSSLDTAAGFDFDIDWGDGSSDTFDNTQGGSVDHTYAQEGDYTITVTVTDRDGGEDTLEHDISVSSIFIDDEGNLLVYGTGGADRIILAETFGGVRIRMNNKTTTIAPESNTVIVFGGNGNDTITVSGRSYLNYILHGDAGNDYLAGGLASDILDGGDGSDRIFGNNGDDFLLGGAGNDRAKGGNGNDIIYGDGYLDEAGDIDLQEVYETAYMDYDGAFYQFFSSYFISNDADGRDNLYGDRGDDLIFGGANNDRLYGGAENDRLYGEDGNDFVDGSNGDDLLVGGDGADSLFGRNGNDVLIGGDGGDRLWGHAGDDLMIGDGVDEFELQDLWVTWSQLGIGAADDLLISIEEDNGALDQLYGYTGLDWFVAFNRDVVRDPRSGDRVDRDAF